MEPKLARVHFKGEVFVYGDEVFIWHALKRATKKHVLGPTPSASLNLRVEVIITPPVVPVVNDRVFIDASIRSRYGARAPRRMLRSNEPGTYIVVFRVSDVDRVDVKVLATWETAEKLARKEVIATYAQNGKRIDGGEVEFLGMY